MSAHYGNFHKRSSTDLEFGTLDADKAISISLEHSSRSLDDEGQSYAYLQCAVLYTTVGGERRVRTINLAMQVAALAGNVFRFADMDAAVCHFAREGERPLYPLFTARNYLWVSKVGNTWDSYIHRI